MAASISTCSVCTLRHLTTSAIIWCQECEESLCRDCEEHHSLARLTRNHPTISIEDYLKLPRDINEISQFCQEHGEQLTIFCKEHNKPCCSKCIVQSHRKCQDISNLGDAIQNIKLSHVFEEVELNLHESKENIDILRKDRTTNLKALDNDEKLIIERVQQTRERINRHLDKIQDTFMKKLYKAMDDKRSIIKDFLVLLDKQEEDIKTDLCLLANIKSYGSNLQAYIAMLQVHERVSNIEKSVGDILRGEACQKYSISCSIDSSLGTFEKQQIAFGNVEINSVPSIISLRRKSRNQAQILVPISSSKQIDDIKLELKETFKNIGGYIYGCSILTGGRAVFTLSDSLRLRNIDGSKELIPCRKYSVDVAVIDDKAIAVSNSREGIDMINIKTKHCHTIISNCTGIWGLTAVKDHIIFCQKHIGICKVNILTETITNIVKVNLPTYCYITSSCDKVYYTNSDDNTVTCYDMRGTMIWEFKDKAELTCPAGVTVDNDGYIYVVGLVSKNVVVISPDGKQYREILSTSNDFKKNSFDVLTLHYDKHENRLLVGICNNKAHLFNVR